MMSDLKISRKPPSTDRKFGQRPLPFPHLGSCAVGARSAAVCQLVNLAYLHDQNIGWDPVAWKFTDAAHAKWMDYERRSEYRM